MNKPTICLVEYEGQAKVYPGDFLGPEHFGTYRTICRSAGCAYNKSLTANLIRIDLVPALLVKLRAAGFAVSLSGEISATALARGAQIISDQLSASARVRDMKDQPYPFQVIGIETLASKTSFLLGDEMGLGKTIQALLAIPANASTLVLCPANLKHNWVKECSRWRPDLAPVILDKFRWPDPGDLAVINYDRLPLVKEDLEGHEIKGCETSLPDLLPAPTGLVLIADEIHYLKGSSKVGRVRRGKQLFKAVRSAGGRIFGMTGTPMPNTPMDLLRILSILDLLRDSFGTYPNFIHMMNGKQDYWGKWKFGKPRPGAVEMLQRVMLRRTREQVLPDLPTITYQDVEVDIPKSARQASDAAREAMAAAGVSLEKIIDGTQGFGESSETVFTARRLLAEAKIPSVLEIVDQYLDAKEPLIVFSAHKAPIIALGAVKGAQVITGQTSPEDRASAVLGFQAGDFVVFGGTIRAAGVGITLTKAAHILIVDDEWTPDWHDQAVSRACRIGQTRGVLVKRLIAPNTIDQDHAAILANKRMLINASVNAAAGPGQPVDPQQLMNLGGIEA